MLLFFSNFYKKVLNNLTSEEIFIRENNKNYSYRNILDFHKDIADKITNKVYISNQRLADSWCNIQGKGSTLDYHNHPNSVVSGIIFLKANEKSSKLVFQNPLTPISPTAVSPHREIYELTPKTGLLAMWPSYLMHGSGASINQSDERIVLSFNTYWK